LLTAPSVAAPAASRASGRYLVVARSAADLSGLRAKAIREGAKVIHSMPQIKAMAIQGPTACAAAWPRTAGPSAGAEVGAVPKRCSARGYQRR
jgi:hypothetical protein